MQPSSFILASKSPRRRELLRQIGLNFDVIPSSIDETIVEENGPVDHVCILSERKARDVAFRLPSGIILGADTIVVIDDEILTKPGTEDEAVRMLQRLSGRKHDVYTGFTLIDVPSWRRVTAWERTEVWFRRLCMEEILRYVASGSPLDKAGAYGIQDDFGAVFVERINGDYYNVVGLPLSRFYCTFTEFLKNGQPPCEDEA
ncbi:MAG: Maf family protein [Bacteroidota bacterium]|nr:Maf family protein [Bacteroidota bacterium]